MCIVTSTTFVSYRHIAYIEKVKVINTAVKRKLEWHCFLTTCMMFYLFLSIFQGLNPTIWKESSPLFNFISTNLLNIVWFQESMTWGREREGSLLHTARPFGWALQWAAPLSSWQPNGACETQGATAGMPHLCNCYTQSDYLLVNYWF